MTMNWDMHTTLAHFRKALLLSAIVACSAINSGCGQDESETTATTDNAGAAVETLEQGQMRPLFSLPDLDGKTRSISEWDGQVVLVNFWATWCPPCRKEMPDFVALKKQYGAQGFEIIGVGIDSPEAISRFAAEIGVNYPLLHGQDDALAIVKTYGNRIGALPFSVLFDRDGKVQMIHAGELTRETLAAELEKQF